jgi:hypothetical protein
MQRVLMRIAFFVSFAGLMGDVPSRAQSVEPVDEASYIVEVPLGTWDREKQRGESN